MMSVHREKTAKTNSSLSEGILSQQKIRHFKILQSMYFVYEVGIISSYSNRIKILLTGCLTALDEMPDVHSSCF